MARYTITFILDELGQDLIEYALLLTFVSLATLMGMQALGLAVTSKYEDASTAITSGERGGHGGDNPGNPTPGAGTPGQGNPGGGNPGKGNGAGGKKP